MVNAQILEWSLTLNLKDNRADFDSVCDFRTGGVIAFFFLAK